MDNEVAVIADDRSIERKRLIIYLVVAFGISYLMIIPMLIGKKLGTDCSLMVNAMMSSPAAGVALGYLFLYKGEKRVPRFFMWTLVACYALLLITAVLSIFAPSLLMNPGGMTVSCDYMAKLLLCACSACLWISYFAMGRKRREFAGLCRNRELTGILLAAVFTVLLFIRVVAPYLMYVLGNGVLAAYKNQLNRNFSTPQLTTPVKKTLYLLPLHYIFSIAAFLGEEYGWRFYLQPVMQKKFGMKKGVILLGLAWALWHIPIDAVADVYASTGNSLIPNILLRIISCVFGGIFMGYAYLKTGNIWIAVAVHFINNNLTSLISTMFSPQVYNGVQSMWLTLIEVLVVEFVVFGLFIFTKEYRTPEKEQTVLTEDSDA